MSLTPPPVAANPTTPMDARVENQNPPAQTCHNPPIPATQQAPAQNKPTAPPPNPQSPHPLAPRQFRAAVLLVRGHTIKTVARHLGVNRHTVGDWLKRPDFQQELNRLLDQ